MTNVILFAWIILFSILLALYAIRHPEYLAEDMSGFKLGFVSNIIINFIMMSVLLPFTAILLTIFRKRFHKRYIRLWCCYFIGIIILALISFEFGFWHIVIGIIFWTMIIYFLINYIVTGSWSQEDDIIKVILILSSKVIFR